MKKFTSSFFFPITVGMGGYFIVSKLWPKKFSDINSEKDFKDLKDLTDSKDFQNLKDLTDSKDLTDLKDSKDLRGGDFFTIKTIKNVIQKIGNNPALKTGIGLAFAAAGYQHFETEIEKLLTHKVFKNICTKTVDGPVKMTCDIIKNHGILNLNDLDVDLKNLIVNHNLSENEKITLLKVKLDYIINADFAGQKRFLIVSSIAFLFTFYSGISGLALFLDALYRLFREGRISRSLYEALIKACAKKTISGITPEEFQELHDL